MTWEELQQEIENMTQEQRKLSIVVAPVNTDRYSPIIAVEWDEDDSGGMNIPHLVFEP